MRAICLIYKYNMDPELYKIIKDAADDMLSIQASNGCISTVPPQLQPQGTSGSDLWERKYVLLGLLGAYEVTKREDILRAAHKMVLHMSTQVGEKPKTPITETGWAFCGIESSSVLEPVVRTYLLTKDEKILEFAKYIVNSGGCSRENIFKAPLNGKSPKDIGGNGNPKESIAKAYEMMSCFEGLIEYYRAAEESWALTAAEHLYDKIVEEELTILGSGGANGPYNLGPGEGEQWNFTHFEQTNPALTMMMDTCVTVTWVKLCYQLLRVTGKRKYADQIEKSGYNLLIGAIRPDGKFFEYFPKLNGYRNRKVNFSYNINGLDLSCCTANGPMGLALLPFTSVMKAEDGIVINDYQKACVNAGLNGEEYKLDIISDYPTHAGALINIEKVPQRGKIYFRIPPFASSFRLMSGNEQISFEEKDGYAIICIGSYREIKAEFEYSPVLVKAPKGMTEKSDHYHAVVYGPLVLARDVYFDEDPLEAIDFSAGIEYAQMIEAETNFAAFKFLADKREFHMLDYSSAGRKWNDDKITEFAVWMPDK